MSQKIRNIYDQIPKNKQTYKGLVALEMYLWNKYSFKENPEIGYADKLILEILCEPYQKNTTLK